MKSFEFSQYIDQWLINGAMISITPGRLLIGWGKCSRYASRSDTTKKHLFYFPDFFLKNPFPWFEYEYVEEIDIENVQKLLNERISFQASSLALSSWKNDQKNLFFETFNEIKHLMSLNELTKAVPFVFETSSTRMTNAQRVVTISNMLKSLRRFPLYIYGFWEDQEGMLGLTPELLFEYHGVELQTMALAGTCRKEDDYDAFLSDPKQAHEHQCVVDGIKESLTPFGIVNTGERQLLMLSALNHLMTPIKLESTSPLEFDIIIKALHPTPALGAFPRIRGMQWLESYQEQIDRKRFGAPVGVVSADGSAKCYVAIRNVQWDEEAMMIGAGCGVVSASECDKEWDEINLKLKATKQMLGLYE